MKPNEIRDAIDLCYGQPMSVVSDCLRGFLIPKPGCRFIAADFNSIEARVLAWLAGEENILEIFRSHGKIYEHQAAGIYSITIDQVTKEQRQMGKVAVLALGYGGGKGAFQSMAKNHNIKISDDDAEKIKLAWRAANSSIVKYWSDLEIAAKTAINTPGTEIKAGPWRLGRHCAFKTAGSFLWCKLPSGRVLCYPYPQINDCDTPWGETKPTVTYMAVNSLSNKWERTKTYGGSLAENVTQAVARDLLAESLVRLEEKNYPVVLHIHDEVVCEVTDTFGSVKEMETIMAEAPIWARDLPISAEGWEGKRYRK